MEQSVAMNMKENKIETKSGNHIMPFLWLRGEDEKTIREYIHVIYDAGCGAVCVESRPHPDFCGAGWWRDMDIILEEAANLDMKVWILDDSHFPTGYAAGNVKTAPPEQKRQGICYKSVPVKGKRVKLSVKHFLKEKNDKLSLMNIGEYLKKNDKNLPQDTLLSVTAIERNTSWLIDLTDSVVDGTLCWKVPEGVWTIGLCKLSFRCGAHRDYINMMDEESCRILIDAVYEPHYAHYGEEFGKTIAGFFSDEPELGNGVLYSNEKLGSRQDLPWSRKLVPVLKETLGRDWKNKLVYLWEQSLDADETAFVRYAYMDAVTKRVRDAFSCQIGDWCRSHGACYIGHVVEDNNNHARTGGSLGHYFRGLEGQDMAGIDDIGGQVMPQGEDGPDTVMYYLKRDGEFYHYILGRLGPSLAAIDPKKKGRTMCEIFGNYGWAEGLRLEKYLADHFLVNGVNYFVPHAFSAAPFPDSDCPPHFYAHGHNPQYRHFRYLMEYMNRVSEICDGGHHICHVALLYHGEAEWTGEAMLMQQAARKMTEAQINFDILPVDVFGDRERFGTHLGEGLTVCTQTFQALVIPYAQYISKDLLAAVEALREQPVAVIFINQFPDGLYDAKEKPDVRERLAAAQAKVCTLEELTGRLEAYRELKLYPDDRQIRYLHYKKEADIFFFVNEGKNRYEGMVELACGGCDAHVTGYEPWKDEKQWIQTEKSGGKLRFWIVLEPSQSYMVLFGGGEEQATQLTIYERLRETKKRCIETGWERSICTSLEYPHFKEKESIVFPDTLSKRYPAFSGWVCYENTMRLDKGTEEDVILEITDAYEGVEVFVNGKSAGVQIVPPYYFTITDLIGQGDNHIRIEVSTTLERERAYAKNKSVMERLQRNKILPPIGINGKVYVRVREREDDGNE